MSVYGAILAGGTGSRMTNHSIPKQFIELKNKPIIIRTIERMLSSNCFDKLFIAIHTDYTEYLKDLLKENNIPDNKIYITNGGKERIDSIRNVMKAIKDNGAEYNDVIITHDAVRPFISKRIIEDSIKAVNEFGACVAVVPAVDTMYVLDNNEYISSFPDRKTLFNGQAPDSFKFGILDDALNKLTEEEAKIITGTVQICAAKGYKIKTIKGDYTNIKITTENDLSIAEGILRELETNESLCINK
ncbi:2-C-methyl-D-erythritol 4-phosphate cytidylyltransferase [bacterium]|nr:2-C-methyl-D-erythritol 4-phosphate cytidylyltransferase [bacterium]